MDTTQGEGCLMSMNEFVNLIVSAGVAEEKFGARDIGTLFNISIMTQVDEIHSERHL